MSKGENVPAKGTVYPTKTGINLVMKEPARVRPTTVVLLVILVLVAIAAVAKLGVIDRYAAVERQAAQYETFRDNLQKLRDSNADYNEVWAEYTRYSGTAISDDEQAIADCMQMLDLVEGTLMGGASVESFAASGNAVSVRLFDISLSGVSTLMARLYESSIVENVQVSTAATSESASDAENNVVTMTITLWREGGAEE